MKGPLHEEVNQHGGELEGVEVTEKGVPTLAVICETGQCELEQTAEVEGEELVIKADIMEEFESIVSNDVIEAGKFLAEQLMKNTVDKNGIIKEVKNEVKNRG